MPPQAPRNANKLKMNYTHFSNILEDEDGAAVPSREFFHGLVTYLQDGKTLAGRGPRLAGLSRARHARFDGRSRPHAPRRQHASAVRGAPMPRGPHTEPGCGRRPPGQLPDAPPAVSGLQLCTVPLAWPQSAMCHAGHVGVVSVAG